jgi:ketosteroid isomerase-like protein
MAPCAATARPGAERRIFQGRRTRAGKACGGGRRDLQPLRGADARIRDRGGAVAPGRRPPKVRSTCAAGPLRSLPFSTFLKSCHLVHGPPGRISSGMEAHSKRSRRAVAFVGLVAALTGCADHDRPADDVVAMLVERSRASNAALMRGDSERYLAQVAVADDFTLFSPFGGEPTRGRPSPERAVAMGRFFRDGTFDQEVVAAYGTADMVVLALVERARVGVGGLPVQPWALRVTVVYRRDGEAWRLVHRHADPLVAGVTLPEAAELARRARAGGG